MELWVVVTTGNDQAGKGRAMHVMTAGARLHTVGSSMSALIVVCKGKDSIQKDTGTKHGCWTG